MAEKSTGKGISSFFVQVFFVVLGAALSFFGTWLYDKWKGQDYGTQAERIEKEIVSQSNLVKEQTGILSGGFSELSSVLRAGNQHDEKIDQLLGSLNEGITNLVSSTKDLSASAANSAALTNYFMKKHDIPSGANEILVSAKKADVEYIDAKNTIGVLAINPNNSNAKVSLNGRVSIWNAGDNRPFINKSGNKCSVTYMGTRADFCIFSTTCGD